MAEDMGDGRSVFFTPREGQVFMIFAGFDGVNIDRLAHTEVIRNVIVASKSLFQNVCSIIRINQKEGKRNTVQIKHLSFPHKNVIGMILRHDYY